MMIHNYLVIRMIQYETYLMRHVLYFSSFAILRHTQKVSRNKFQHPLALLSMQNASNEWSFLSLKLQTEAQEDNECRNLLHVLTECFHTNTMVEEQAKIGRLYNSKTCNICISHKTLGVIIRLNRTILNSFLI